MPRLGSFGGSRGFGRGYRLFAPTSVEYLIVAGGGAGGPEVAEFDFMGDANFFGGGGGGAGGYRTGTASVVSGTTYTINVGAGGATGGLFDGQDSSKGQDSTAFGIVSSGGGRASSQTSIRNGGSGAGAGRYSAAGTGTSGQGNGGGAFAGDDGGGGGGAGGTGFAGGNSGTSSNGGTGTASSITGTSLFYAGGGGGGRVGTFTAAAGGSGVGGQGATNSGASSTPGSANRGGGGGAGSQNRSPSNGGSGVVIFRYPDTFPLATSTTGSPTVTTTGGFRIYQFTGSGTVTF